MAALRGRALCVGEWWGQGSVVVPALRDAQRLGRSARARGFFVHVHVHKE